MKDTNPKIVWDSGIPAPKMLRTRTISANNLMSKSGDAGQVEELKKSLGVLQKEKTRVEQDAKEVHEAYVKAQQDVKDLESKLSGMKKSLQIESENTAALKEKMAHQDELVLKTEQLTIQLEKERIRVKELDVKYSQVVEQKHILDANVRVLNDKLSQALQKLSDAESVIQGLRADKEKIFKDLEVAEVSKKELQDVRSELMASQDLFSKAKENLVMMQQEKANLDLNLRSLQKRIDDMSAENIAKSNEVLSQFKSQEQLDLEISDLKELLKSEQELHDSAKTKLSEFEAKVAGIHARVVRLEEEKKQLEKQVLQLSTDLDKNGILLGEEKKKSRDLETKNSELSRRIDLLNSDIATLMPRIEEMTKSVVEKEFKLAEVESNLAFEKKSKGQLEALQERTAIAKLELQEDVDRLEHRVKNLQMEQTRRVKDLEEKVGELKGMGDAATEDLSNALKDLDEADTTIKQKEARIEELSTELFTTQALLSSCKQELEEMKKKRPSLFGRKASAANVDVGSPTAVQGNWRQSTAAPSPTTPTFDKKNIRELQALANKKLEEAAEEHPMHERKSTAHSERSVSSYQTQNLKNERMFLLFGNGDLCDR